MKKYEIVLQNKKAKIYAAISWLIIAINLLLFFYLGITKLTGKTMVPLSAAILLALILTYYLITRKNKVNFNNQFVFAFIIIVLTWIILGFYIPAVINLLLFLFQDITRRPLKICIEDKQVTYPSFPKRMIQWNELTNMILKDGLLTIDFKNNKIIQQMVDKADHPLNEKEFNDFCREQLHLAAATV